MVDIYIMRARIAERKVMQEGHIHYSFVEIKSEVHHRLILVYKIIIMEGL